MNAIVSNPVGIIGAGRLGQAMALDRAACRPLRRDRQQPRPRIADVRGLGARHGSLGGTADEAAAAGIVVIAVPWDRVPEAVQGLDGTVRSSSTRPTTGPPTIGLGGKAANTLGAEVLGSTREELAAGA